MIRILMLAMLLSFLNGCHLRARSKVADKVTFHDNLNYSPDKDKDAGFDLYVPKNAQGKVPAVIYIHGGYWRNQSRSYYQTFTGLYQNIGLALASRGVATAVIDYRLYPRARVEDQMSDIEAAVSYLKNNAGKYGIDPMQIHLVGHSAGGHLALMTLWQKKNADVRTAVALSPILDIAHMRAHKDAGFNKELTQPFFGTGNNDTKFSPAMYAAADSRAALILFGEKDYEYLVEQGKKYTERFSAAGLKQVQFGWVSGTDHSDMVMSIHTPDDKVSDQIARYILATQARK